MEHTFAHMEPGMLKVLLNDPLIPADVFSAHFPQEDFVHFVLNHILLMQGQPDCNMLLEIIPKVIRRF